LNTPENDNFENAYDPGKIRVIRPETGEARYALINTYRLGLADGATVAWTRTLDEFRQMRPEETEERRLILALFLTLGLFHQGSDRERIAAGEIPNSDAWHPVLLNSGLGSRVWDTARAHGMSADDLVSLIVDAWMSATCDFDGLPVFPDALGSLQRDPE
jgi:hypothetical protein